MSKFSMILTSGAIIFLAGLHLSDAVTPLSKSKENVEALFQQLVNNLGEAEGNEPLNLFNEFKNKIFYALKSLKNASFYTFNQFRNNYKDKYNKNDLWNALTDFQNLYGSETDYPLMNEVVNWKKELRPSESTSQSILLDHTDQ